MKLTIELTRPFSEAVGAKTLEGDFNASDVDGLIHELVNRHPDLRSEVFDENGEVGIYISIFVNDKPVTALDGLNTALSEGDKIVFLMPISGG